MKTKAICRFNASDIFHNITQKGPHCCGPLFNAGLDPIGATPLQDDIGNKTPSCSFYVKHFT